MNIHYHCSGYISHRRAGEAYMACLRDMGHVLSDDPARSDLVILHEEPFRYARTLEAMGPDPGRRRVGFAVWETPQLPAAFIEGLRLVDAVWTPSEFSRRAFAPHAPAFVLPHVVTRPVPSKEDIAWAAGRAGMRDARREARREFYFYTIIDSVNPRKDIRTLLAAFATAFPENGTARLVVKQYREPLELGGIPNVIDIPEMLDDGKIAALHAVCDVYVSAHHAEAWGLPLSEAMAFGNPVIATGYSGNMEFMNRENSFPVPYTVVPVPDRMCRALPRLFSPDMTWADIDVPALVLAMRSLRDDAPGPAFRRRVASSMKAFAPDKIRERLGELLQQVMGE